MKREIIAFRAFLVFLGASILATSGLWLYEKNEASTFQEYALAKEREYDEHMKGCEKEVREKNAPNCAAAQHAQVMRDMWRDSRNRHSENAENYLLMLLILPASFVLCFYAGRWILTGQLRPFWLLNDD